MSIDFDKFESAFSNVYILLNFEYPLTFTLFCDKMSTKEGDNMSEYKGYNESRKKASIKYIKEKRENLNINLPKGKKDEYKQLAESRGMSLTALIVKLLEDEMAKGE